MLVGLLVGVKGFWALYGISVYHIHDVCCCYNRCPCNAVTGLWALFHNI
jgi:hypothetical protein